MLNIEIALDRTQEDFDRETVAFAQTPNLEAFKNCAETARVRNLVELVELDTCVERAVTLFADLGAQATELEQQGAADANEVRTKATNMERLAKVMADACGLRRDYVAQLDQMLADTATLQRVFLYLHQRPATAALQ